ncbi:MAG: hypothetical protein AAGD43_21435 [Pseudomonadota bacterium]
MRHIFLAAALCILASIASAQGQYCTATAKAVKHHESEGFTNIERVKRQSKLDDRVFTYRFWVNKDSSLKNWVVTISFDETTCMIIKGFFFQSIHFVALVDAARELVEQSFREPVKNGATVKEL